MKRPSILRPESFLTVIWFLVLGVIVVLRVWHDSSAIGPGDAARECGTEELEHNDGAETWIYHHVMPRLRAGGQPHVALLVLAQPAVPLHYFLNVCDSRQLITDLMPRLAALQPRVIALDKFYSDGACPQEGVNAHFRQVLNSIARSIPVVVGAAAQEPQIGSAQAPADDCLTLVPAFSFDSPGRADSSYVSAGLIRLNENTLQIPLAWSVREPVGGNVTQKPSFALTAAEAFDPSLARDPYIARYASEKVQSHHPFGEYPDTLPTWSAMDVLCMGSAPEIEREQPEACKGRPESTVDLRGKIVVVGEHISRDTQPFPGGLRYGMDLQGDYINALVARQFLRQMPISWDWAEVVSVVSIPILFELVDSSFPGLRRHIRGCRSSWRGLVIVGYTLSVWLVFLVIDALLLAYAHIYPPIFVLSMLPIGGGIVCSLLPAFTSDVKGACHLTKRTA